MIDFIGLKECYAFATQRSFIVLLKLVSRFKKNKIKKFDMATAHYPLPAFHFRVDWGGTSISFTEVTGLNIENQVIEYRDGANPQFTMQKMPGIQKFGNITLKRGIFKGDNDYYNWLDTISMNTIERRDVSISLLDETHSPVMVWKVKNAFPSKLEGASLKASGNEVAIESLEIAHEGLVVENN